MYENETSQHYKLAWKYWDKKTMHAHHYIFSLLFPLPVDVPTVKRCEAKRKENDEIVTSNIFFRCVFSFLVGVNKVWTCKWKSESRTFFGMARKQYKYNSLLFICCVYSWKNYMYRTVFLSARLQLCWQSTRRSAVNFHFSQSY